MAEHVLNPNATRILVIGAGSRGNAYARAVQRQRAALIVGVVEPLEYKREAFGKKFVWHERGPREEESFSDWTSFLQWASSRHDSSSGESAADTLRIDGIFICTLDHLHAEAIVALAPLKLHIMSEKPLATTLIDCVRISAALRAKMRSGVPSSLFLVCHVLRYSPHNKLLHDLLVKQKAIGEILFVEHTEPVGWWHFAHSYVRGNWRNEATSGPSLLTKSCHDIDILMWLLCGADGEGGDRHLPKTITSQGDLLNYRRSRKPKSAGEATNCLRCEAEPDCIYSARKIYVDRLRRGTTGFPIRPVLPDVEDLISNEGVEAAERALLAKLEIDYTDAAEASRSNAKSWYGRCVYEANNDVCDNQVVTLSWDEDTLGENVRPAKMAAFHMVASTAAVCERRTRVYGTLGELETDSHAITIHGFVEGADRQYVPVVDTQGGHGGGDDGIVASFIEAIDAVKTGRLSVVQAQETILGCTMEDVLLSHYVVFAAEEARKGKMQITYQQWYQEKVLPLSSEMDLQRG